MQEQLNIELQGHILIKDQETDEILVNKNNKIHFENMSLALARSLGNKSQGPIEKMFFGNGGSTVNGLGEVTYLPPNVVGQSADLYNSTYSKIVDDNNVNNVDTSANNHTIAHTGGNLFSDLVVTCTLDYSEPQGQDAFDTGTTTEGLYVFDELGLVDYSGNLTSHVIFHPVQKSLNRAIKIIYTLRIRLV